jgi:hypothetical protein
MIGSQSTKGIHFLQLARLLPVATGVWGRESTVAIETYPAAAVRDVEVARLMSQLLADVIGRENRQRSDAWRADVRDAISCALVALLHRSQPGRLEAPPEGADATERWTWLPAAVTGVT